MKQLKLVLAHKFKLLMLPFFVFSFCVLLFPYNDLSDLLTKQVSQATGGNVYLSATNLEVEAIGGLSVALKEAVVQLAGLPAITLSRWEISPSVASLLALQGVVTSKLEGLFMGKSDVQIDCGSLFTCGSKPVQVNVSVEKMQLEPMIELLGAQLGLPLKILGSASGEVAMSVDPTGKQPPTGKVSLKGMITELSGLEVAQFALKLPRLQFSQVNVDTTLGEDKLTLNNVVLGSDQDAFSVKLKGEMAVVHRAEVTELGSYDFTVDLAMRPGAPEILRTAASLLGFEKFKRDGAADRERYVFRAKAGKVGTEAQLLPVTGN